MDPTPDIYLIILDSLRADHAPPYNNKYMEALSSIAKESYVFKNAYSTASWTIPAHASILSGKYPSNHGITSKSKTFRMDPGESLAERVSSMGYATGLVSANPWITPNFNFDVGFDTVPDLFPRPPFENIDDPRSVVDNNDSIIGQALDISRWSLSGKTLRRLVKAAYIKFIYEDSYPDGEEVTNSLETVMESTSSPKFIMANYMDAHEPYPEEIPDSASQYWNLNSVNNSPPLESSELKSIYQSAVKRLDSEINELVNISDMPDDAIQIFVGDHGQALGENGYWGHGTYLYKSITHVPLIIRPPGGTNQTIIENGWSLRQLYRLVINIINSNSGIKELILNLQENSVMSESAGPHMDVSVPEGAVSFEGYRSYRTSEWYLIKNLGNRIECASGELNNHDNIKRYLDELDKKFNLVNEFTSNKTDIDYETKQKLQDLGYM